MQTAFDFSAPIAPSAVPLARHCSSMGARHAQERFARQALALLTLYRQRGPLTDKEAAQALGVERSTINARRNELVKRGLVTAVGVRRSEDTRINNTTWTFSTEAVMSDDDKPNTDTPDLPATSADATGDSSSEPKADGETNTSVEHEADAER